jgi:hypothetical protein
MKGVHTLGSAGCGEKRELEVWDYCEDRTWVLGCCVWRVENQWVESPCGLIASTRGWPTIERK